jgi:putative spermidine/putrescine transport system ATP-binding protein
MSQPDTIGQVAASPDDTSPQPLLEVRDLTKTYGREHAVDRLSFDVRRGEFFTLLGPSGCGKSTTLMAIAGFVHPDAGTVRLDGQDLLRRPPDRRGLGVMFQSYALFPHMTVLQNVMFPLRMRHVPRKQALAAATEALELVQLSELHASPATLSGGQRQRVALARALVFQPAVLLMDEPLGALDRRLRQELQFQFRSLQSQLGTTVLWVTHDQEEALALSDRVAVMRAGRFEQVDHPEQVYRAPASLFVARFLGESNALPVQVVRRDNGAALVMADGMSVAVAVDDNPAVESQGLLILRPQDVVLAGEAPPGPHLSGFVTDTVFLGEFTRVEVVDAFDRKWLVSLRERHHPAGLGPGSFVYLCWSPRTGQLVPAT